MRLAVLFLLTFALTLAACDDLSVLRDVAERGGIPVPAGSDPCAWAGVGCDATGAVTSLAWSGLSALPASVSGLPFLTRLSLTRGRISAIPASLFTLRRLESLDLSFNSITAIPDTVSLSPLRSLNLDNNLVGGLPAAFFGSITSIEALFLRNNRVSGVLPSFEAHGNLTRLYVRNNRLSGLDGLPASLEELYAYNNLLSDLGPSIASLPRLRILNVRNNPLGDSLRDLSRLESLEELLLTNISATAVPLFHGPSLIRLDLNSNKLAGKVALCGAALRVANLNDNAITFFNRDRHGCLPSVESINLADNRLVGIAVPAGQAVTLVDLDLSDNPGMGSELLSKGVCARFPSLNSLRLVNTGLVLEVAEALISLKDCKLLTTLDLSRSPGLTGSLSLETLGSLGTSFSFPFLVLRLDQTNITQIGADYTARRFSSLRELSVRGIPGLAPSMPSDWLHLQVLDTRGSFGSAVVSWRLGSDVERYPGSSMLEDPLTKSICPAAIVGGDVSRYSVSADPANTGFALCTCLPEHFGSPALAGGCKPCAGLVMRGADGSERTAGLSVSCEEGVLNATGVWLVYDPARPSRIAAVPCPSDTDASPCSRVAVATVPSGPGQLPSSACAAGHAGRLCSRCKRGYFRSGRGCLPCSSGASVVLPLVSLMLLPLLGVQVVLGGHATRGGLLRTLTLHAQLFSSLPDMTVKFSSSVSFLFRFTGAGSALRLEGVECLRASRAVHYDGFFGPVIVSALLPVCVLVGSALIAAIAAIVRVAKSVPAHQRNLGADLVLGGTYLWFVLVFNAVAHLLSPLNCTGYGTGPGLDGGSFVAVALWVRCGSPDHRALLGVGVTAAAVFLLITAVPLAKLARSKRQPPEGEESAALSSSEGVLQSFLTSPYKRSARLWEAVQIGRRVVLALVITLSPFGSSVMQIGVSTVLIVALFLQARFMPFRVNLDNNVEVGSLVLLLISYNLRAVKHDAGPVIILLVNIAFISALTLAVLWGMIRGTATRLKSILLCTICKQGKPKAGTERMLEEFHELN
jgi:Leucine-rich repeat (LRR) protein